jgi:hypothetical protein
MGQVLAEVAVILGSSCVRISGGTLLLAALLGTGVVLYLVLGLASLIGSFLDVESLEDGQVY